MIEQIEGTRETVTYITNPMLRLHLNHEAEDYPLHWHSEIEIIMPLTGNYTLVVEDVDYLLDTEDILIIPSGSLHKIVRAKSGERLIYQISPRIFMDNGNFHALSHLLFPCIHLKKQDNEVYTACKHNLLTMAEEYRSDSFLRESAIQAKILSLSTELGRALANEKKAEANASAHFSGKFHDAFILTCDYITTHPAQEFSTEELAARAGLSKFYFLRQFKQYTGSTLWKYITGLRMKQAEQLLGSCQLPVTDIAMQSGFGSIATFNRIFREYHNCTPTQYREMNEH